MEFNDLITQLKHDSEVYHFCEEGKTGLARSTSALECFSFLRENIMYCFRSKYHHAIAEKVADWYARWKDEFNRCGIWVNEHTPESKGIVLLTEENIHDVGLGDAHLNSFPVNGKERCYLFGNKRMSIQGCAHSQIYSRNPAASFSLEEYSYGFIHDARKVDVKDHASCYAENSKVRSSGHCQLFLTPTCKWKNDGHGECETIQHVGF